MPVPAMPVSPVWYVYGIVRPSLELGGAPAGVEGASLLLVPQGDVAALSSAVDGLQYAPDALERMTEDVDWLALRAVAHDRVLSWASDRSQGAVIPFPMFSLFSGEQSVKAMLRERASQLTALLQRTARGREYALRVYRVNAELKASVATLSPRLAELERAARQASPGQQYLLQRKLEAEKKGEIRAVGRQIARELYERLAPRALDAREGSARQKSKLPDEGELVLDAAFLVAHDGFEAFQRELSSALIEYQSKGFRFDFTGPWPPYHFAQEIALDGGHGA
jgi:hypothetical protein